MLLVFPLRKSVTKVSVVTAMLMPLQGAALSAWDSALQQTSPASPHRGSCLSTERVNGHLVHRGGACSYPALLCTFLLPWPDPCSSSASKSAVCPKASASKSSTSTKNSTWMSADVHIYVFQTSHSLPFLCVYCLPFLLTGCGPLAARAQMEINELPS